MRISFPILGLLSLVLLNANWRGEGGAEASYDAEPSDLEDGANFLRD